MTMQIQQQSFAEQVYERIKSMILAGRLRGGQRISEEALANEFGVSRTPVREALRRLGEYGLVHIKPRSYAEVAQLREAEVEQVLQVREALEVLSVQTLAARASQDDIVALRDLGRQCRDALRRELAHVFELDSRLHLEIARRGGNSALVALMDRLDAKVQLTRLARCTAPESVGHSLRQHDAILDAVAAHDVERAGRLMALHVRGESNDRANLDR